MPATWPRSELWWSGLFASPIPRQLGPRLARPGSARLCGPPKPEHHAPQGRTLDPLWPLSEPAIVILFSRPGLGPEPAAPQIVLLLGLHPRRHHQARPAPARHRGALEGEVAPITQGQVGLAQRCHRLLHRVGLAGQDGLVGLQLHGIEHTQVREAKQIKPQIPVVLVSASREPNSCAGSEVCFKKKPITAPDIQQIKVMCA